MKKKLCVFCGSSRGHNPRYAELAQSLGKFLVEQGWDLVYGGSTIGLMGILADSVMEHGGEVYGVTPKVLEKLEIVHHNIHNLYQVDSMHERKQLMYELSDAFLAIPGGIGTWDELCEVTCWKQLNIHQRPIVLLNAFSYYDPFLSQIEHSINEGFTREDYRHNIQVANCLQDLTTLL